MSKSRKENAEKGVRSNHVRPSDEDQLKIKKVISDAEMLLAKIKQDPDLVRKNNHSVRIYQSIIAIIATVYVCSLYNHDKTPGENLDSCLAVGKDVIESGFSFINSLLTQDNTKTPDIDL